jgi:hypothetical protein
VEPHLRRRDIGERAVDRIDDQVDEGDEVIERRPANDT